MDRPQLDRIPIPFIWLGADQMISGGGRDYNFFLKKSLYSKNRRKVCFHTNQKKGFKTQVDGKKVCLVTKMLILIVEKPNTSNFPTKAPLKFMYQQDIILFCNYCGITCTCVYLVCTFCMIYWSLQNEMFWKTHLDNV